MTGLTGEPPDFVGMAHTATARDCYFTEFIKTDGRETLVIGTYVADPHVPFPHPPPVFLQ
jgi:hypothetical protein